jgi:regulator of replication initiation timing
MNDPGRFLAAEIARISRSVLNLQAENDRLRTENENLRENLRRLAEEHYDAPVGIHLPTEEERLEEATKDGRVE